MFRVTVELEALESFDLGPEVLDDPFGLLANLVLQIKQIFGEVFVLLVDLKLFSACCCGGLVSGRASWVSSRFLCWLCYRLLHFLLIHNPRAIRTVLGRRSCGSCLCPIVAIIRCAFGLLSWLRISPKLQQLPLLSRNIHSLRLHERVSLASAGAHLRNAD